MEFDYKDIEFVGNDHLMNRALNDLRRQMFEDMLRLLPVVVRKCVQDVLDLEVGVRAFVQKHGVPNGQLDYFLERVNANSAEDPTLGMQQVLEKSWLEVTRELEAYKQAEELNSGDAEAK